MSKLNRIILYSLVIVFSIIWIAYSADSSEISNGFAPQEGFSAPDFTLKTTTGEIYTLSDLKGQAVLVNLWATWCPPCRAEMPAMQRIYEEYQEQGLVILAVNMTYQDAPLDIMPFVNEYRLTFPILLDETGKVAHLYQLPSLPSSYFINRAGIITEVVIGGPMSEALLRTRIEKILE
jgi:cytochrome c biogenesis protein CcmG/thiol:disulfide interchange protein DsbE